MRQILAFLIIISLNCCTGKGQSHISFIHSKGLAKESTIFQTMFFQNPSLGFIGGSIDSIWSNNVADSDTFAFGKEKAVIFRTVDGAKNWDVKEFGEGSVTRITQFDNTLYAIVSPSDTIFSKIYQSTDDGKTWILFKSFPGIADEIFYHESKYIVTGKLPGGSFEFYNSSEKNMSWSKIPLKHFAIADCIMQKGYLYFLSSQDANNDARILNRVNLSDLSYETIPIPAGVYGRLLRPFDEGVCVVGDSAEKVSVFSIKNSENRLQSVYQFSCNDGYKPFDFFKNGDEHCWLFWKISGIGVIYQMRFTYNNGQTWNTVNFEKNDNIQPYFLYQASRVVNGYFFSGLGRIQKLE